MVVITRNHKFYHKNKNSNKIIAFNNNILTNKILFPIWMIVKLQKTSQGNSNTHIHMHAHKIILQSTLKKNERSIWTLSIFENKSNPLSNHPMLTNVANTPSISLPIILLVQHSQSIIPHQEPQHPTLLHSQNL